MSDLDYDDLARVFSVYGTYPSISLHTDTFNINDYHSTYQMAGNTTVDVTMKFYSLESFNQFAKDVSRVRDLLDERDSRYKNPAVQQAYEEYQILLKLSK
jgi:hypothetical protein